MKVLGIDSSTRTASVAVMAGEQVAAERELPGARHLAATLLPLIDQAMSAAGSRVGDLDLVAVSIGPGSFTGLRIGLSVAKGIALSTGCEVVGVSSLEALAMVAGRVGGGAGWICPVLDARRGEVYASLFRRLADGGCERVVDDFATSPEDLASFLAARVPAGARPTLVGDGVEPYRAVWERLHGGAAELLPFSEFHPSGGAVARLGRRHFDERGGDQAGALVPRYCRVAEAEQKRIDRMARQAPAGNGG